MTNEEKALQDIASGCVVICIKDSIEMNKDRIRSYIQFVGEELGFPGEMSTLEREIFNLLADYCVLLEANHCDNTLEQWDKLPDLPIGEDDDDKDFYIGY